ncbi:MAG: carbonic anhydrase family protein [Bacteroidales bacterium]|nr:carbonic anhydrase family protein [Bacteroidales bacterium]MCF8456277.1 carbonic anhydrase family protein [Bacteroidales bacterium]
MKKILLNSFLVIVFAAAMVSCNPSAQSDKTTKKENHEQLADGKNDCDHVHWSHHSGEEGPEHWKDLCSGFNACGGQAQSPIDIITTETKADTSLSAFELKYSTTPVEIINNGHTVQFNTFGNNILMIGKKEYKLMQFHYHALSEHTVNGNHYPLELHLVHTYSDSDLAVLGILFEEGEANELFTEYLAKLPVEKGRFESKEMIELRKLFPADLDYYHYKGSLTTPPCSEVVSWYVLRSPVKASKEQIAQFSKILHDNYRPVMPLNDRKVLSFED